MATPRQEVASLAEFAEWVEEVSDLFETPPIWFRGAGREAYPLLPGLYRYAGGREKWTDDELRAEFSRRAIALPKELLPRTDWEWYFLMQHYRVPTRLLDWTEAALVALHFAISSWEEAQVRLTGGMLRNTKLRRGTRPAVWALDPWAVNDHLGFEGPVNAEERAVRAYLPPVYTGRLRIPQRPIAVDPPLVAQRLLVQRSHFTLHGRDRRPLEEMPHVRWVRTGKRRRRPALVKVAIAAPDRDELGHLRWQLQLCGVTPTSIFPDMEGLARELVQEYQVY
jgi:hypothetical protein